MKISALIKRLWNDTGKKCLRSLTFKQAEKKWNGFLQLLKNKVNTDMQQINLGDIP
jgi:hypothetical protein